jgi:hypothetical protein
MMQRVSVGIICGLLFTVYFTIFGASSYFETYLTFSIAIYLLLGVPTSILIDNLVKKYNIKTIYGSLLLYALAGMAITTLCLSFIGLGELEFFLHHLLQGAIAGMLFFLIHFFVSLKFKAHSQPN